MWTGISVDVPLSQTSSNVWIAIHKQQTQRPNSETSCIVLGFTGSVCRKVHEIFFIQRVFSGKDRPERIQLKINGADTSKGGTHSRF